MQKNISLRLILLAVAVLIVLPVNGSVKHLSSNRAAVVSVAVSSGSPLPAPNPPGFSIAGISGSPLPAPNPPGFRVRFSLARAKSPGPYHSSGQRFAVTRPKSARTDGIGLEASPCSATRRQRASRVVGHTSKKSLTQRSSVCSLRKWMSAPRLSANCLLRFSN
jgi:hypothetical protein